MTFLYMFFSLVIILFSCELFTNGIEWLGKKIKVGDGVTGSVFSAIGTCLPETMVPIIAILISKGSEDGTEIGIGAILGAPFMLSSLAFFVLGIGGLLFLKKRGGTSKLSVDCKIISRDIIFFGSAYIFVLFAACIDNRNVKNIISVFLICFYVCYIFMTVKQDKAVHRDLEPLYITKLSRKGRKITIPLTASIFIQIIFAISGIIIGAYIFVENIKEISQNANISALVLSLIITPIATELPEKFNSLIWIAQKKDTLALGNITGAMVFQSCIPVSIGIFLTDWKLDSAVTLSVILAMLSAASVFIYIKLRKKLTIFPLLAGGMFYLIFLVFTLKNILN